MKRSSLPLKYSYDKIEVGDSDYKQADPRALAGAAFQIFLIRAFENCLLALAADGCVHGPVHTSIGQEACAVGAMAALERGDKIAATHRAHHHYLAKAMRYFIPDDYDILAAGGVPDAAQAEVTRLMAEVMGLAPGCCGGRGGSMHLHNTEIGVIGTNAIVAGGVPLATGAAFALKYQKRRDVVVCFLGDGAVNQGAFHEAINLAGIWQLPIVYFIENNEYAVATRSDRSTVPTDLVVKAAAYGVKGIVVDGMNPQAVSAAVRLAAENARNSQGATLIEAKCYRHLHHAGPTPGSSFGYRTKEEEAAWQDKDPHHAFPKELVDRRIFSQRQLDQIRGLAQKSVDAAMSHCASRVDNKYVTRKELWPAANTLTMGLRSDGTEFAGVQFREIEDFSAFESMTYVQAVAAITGRHLKDDPDVFVLGEEVANFGGGPYGATKGLPQLYPDRVLNTPISECGFVGLAGGAAMTGLKPVVEIMFPDFALVAADQLFNQIGKLRHMYGNTTAMPVVVRTRIAIGCGYGGQHSMDPVGLFSLFSGWRIVAPSTAFDYIGLFNSAMRCKDPVVIIEHQSLYPMPFDVPKDQRDYYVRLGSAKIIKTGSDVTVLCYLATAGLAAKAANELESQGVSAEVIDLRTLSPADIDYDTIGRSLMKTSMMVIVEQAAAGLSIGPKIAAECTRRFFDYLDGPIEMLSGADVPPPVSRALEAIASPSLESVKDAVTRAAGRK